MDINKIAIIGPTASGKSDLAIKLAKKLDAYILSIDSLSIYKEVDIISAKPSKKELEEVKHFGIDELYIDEYFSVEVFIRLYKEVEKLCKKEKKDLVIVGGTSFYLKTLIDGLSSVPKPSKEILDEVKEELKDMKKTYSFLYALDKEYMSKISKNDRYRIEKALTIYKTTKTPPSIWFKENPKKPVIKDVKIYNIDIDRDVLRDRIKKRTNKMIKLGAIDEVRYLEQKYTREPNPMKAIGIVEILDFLDGKTTKEEMVELISIHTAQLAKRQQTFNKNQFKDKVSMSLEELERYFKL